MVSARSGKESKRLNRRSKTNQKQDNNNNGRYFCNIMYDRRVIRGNTYASQVVEIEPKNILNSSNSIQNSKKEKKEKYESKRMLLTTPEPIEGRCHNEVQTDLYLEELTDIFPEVDCSTQTDKFLDRPASPLFIPQKSGPDASTQIEPGDLFDFDYEVEPILEVFVGKTLEQGLMEVLEEEELAAIKEHQRQMDQIQHAELVIVQRMEAIEKRKLNEKERRLAQEKERLKHEFIIREKVAASTFARSLMNGIVHDVFEDLRETGYFYDPVKKELEVEFLPYLKNKLEEETEKEYQVMEAIDLIIVTTSEKWEQMINERLEIQKNRENRQIYIQERTQSLLNSINEEIKLDRENKATTILYELEPKLVDMEEIEAIKQELIAKFEAEVDEQWEELKKAKADEIHQKLAEKNNVDLNEEESIKEDVNEDIDTENIEEEEEVNEEELIKEEVDKIERPIPNIVKDDDILNVLLERNKLTNEMITTALISYYYTKFN